MKFSHPIARTAERYHLSLTPDDFDAIKRLVCEDAPEVFPIGRRPDGTHLVAVRYRPPRKQGRPRWLATVWRGYDLLTVLPEGALERDSWRLREHERTLQAAGCRAVREAAASGGRAGMRTR
jgi:hypothetical protein